MLSEDQLATAISAVLVAAIALGWLLHWIWIRLSNAAVSDSARLNEMTSRLHDADHARGEAEEARDEAERMLAERAAEMDSRLSAMQARLDGAIEGREAALSKALRESRADAEASMDGLHRARQQIVELETRLADLSRASG